MRETVQGDNCSNRVIDSVRGLKTSCQFLASYKYIRPYLESKKTLDIGCATGDYLETFSRKSIGVDLSATNIKICQSKGLNAVQADLNKRLPFHDNGFEAVFCSHTLEHVDSPINLLREINRVLQRNGVVVVGLPTEYSIVRFLKDHYFKGHKGHLYSFSIANLEQLFKLVGFKKERVIIDINWVYRYSLWWLLNLVQKFPAVFTIWWSNAFWIVGQKIRNYE